MEFLSPSNLFNNWQRKLIALFGAVALWLFVNQSITSTKTITNVPVRLINLPTGRTVEGLLPNGILSKRLTLTLTGTKDVVDNLEPSEIEVVIDAANLPDEWVLDITKKNLISLNPNIDLTSHISSVEHNEMLIKMSKLVTEKIPVRIAAPTGEAPEGYQMIDIWPQNLYQTVTGPQEQVRLLKEKGVMLTFDLNQISKADLDKLKTSKEVSRDDEVQFKIPDKWKKIVVPIGGEVPEAINDPLAQELAITFLRIQLLPIGVPLPIRVYYPVETLGTLNPTTFPLSNTPPVQLRNGVTFLNMNLMAKEVSQLFLDIVRDNMEISIVAAPKTERESLQWSVQFINEGELEDTFVAFLMNARGGDTRLSGVDLKKKESRLRRRFRDYMLRLRLYNTDGNKLVLESKLGDKSITVRDVTASN